MANARQRRADRRTRQRDFHLRRIEAASTLVEKLEAAFGLLRADLINTSNTAKAQAIGLETLTFLTVQSERIPRSSE
ncbi:hypothetical protein [Streptosporangium lutulentum]|uniref:Uncharacterized protein n=1 Tax=Streptosporangium lutulentum TaxID=1461250 RepID=A0ABT9QUA1_9ACTN|nr:hypothetical protein [Streptosporangium lutulentum]MDP9850327.1 hypothetical protein [Streptosporangium lutulentum]